MMIIDKKLFIKKISKLQKNISLFYSRNSRRRNLKVSKFTPYKPFVSIVIPIKTMRNFQRIVLPLKTHRISKLKPH